VIKRRRDWLSARKATRLALQDVLDVLLQRSGFLIGEEMPGTHLFVEDSFRKGSIRVAGLKQGGDARKRLGRQDRCLGCRLPGRLGQSAGQLGRSTLRRHGRCCGESLAFYRVSNV
jgi:hypothetical protein